MGNLNFGVQNILDGQGFTIAITGMLIVFAALAIISLFIAALPKLLIVLETPFPVEHHHAPPAGKSAKDDTALLAAIGFGLYKAGAIKTNKN